MDTKTIGPELLDVGGVYTILVNDEVSAAAAAAVLLLACCGVDSGSLISLANTRVTRLCLCF